MCFLLHYLYIFFLVLRWLKFWAEQGLLPRRGIVVGGNKKKKKMVLPCLSRWKVVSQSRFRCIIYRGKKDHPSTPKVPATSKAWQMPFLSVISRIPSFILIFCLVLSKSKCFSNYLRLRERESTTNSPSPNKCVYVCIQTQGDHNNILYIPQQRNAYLPLIKSLIKQLNNSPFQKHNDTRTYVLPSDVEQG